MNGGTIALDLARSRLLDPTGLDDAGIDVALGELGAGADLADLYFEHRAERSWRLEDGKVVAGSFTITQGVGARASQLGRVGFAHSADLRLPALRDTVQAVRTMRRHGDDARHPAGVAVNAGGGDGHALYAADPVIGQDDAHRWIALLRTIDILAREADPRVTTVEAGLRGVDKTILVADLDRGLIADVRPAIHLWLNVVVQMGERRARGRAGLGGRHGLAGLTEAAIQGAIDRAVRIATVNLDARSAPAGVMPVVLAPGYPGVLFHEAVGHGLEGDHHRLALSAFTGRIGDRIAAPGVTVIDDGGIPDRLGSLGIDDEGTPPDRTVLVEDGVLRGLLQDRTNAALMNGRPTGNGRRQSYSNLPLPRMTNTYLAAGSEDPSDIVRSVTKGIYARELGGGQVDIVTGRFNFTTTEAWLIEDGRLTAPIDGATLIGVGHEALRGITTIGSDLALDAGEALCGKQGQQLDVSVGQPTLRIDGMTVGGRGG